MGLLTDFVSKVGDLLCHLIKVEANALLAKVENQAKHLECGLKRISLWCSLLLLYVFLLLAGVGAIMWGAYTLLAVATGPGVAALIVGAIASLLAVSLIACTKSSIR